jgi:hypothetical protein
VYQYVTWCEFWLHGAEGMFIGCGCGGRSCGLSGAVTANQAASIGFYFYHTGWSFQLHSTGGHR